MIKTRFAPSPTGYLHIGAARTALFAWLMARQNNGQFFLRIEDTDQARFVAGAEAHIEESLNWLGLNWNNEKPIRQSENLDSYLPVALKLIEQGKAYADPTPPAELDRLRQLAKAEKRPFHYRQHRPQNPPAWQKGVPIRLKIEAQQSPAWFDEIRGEMKPSTDNIDDFILIKADGFPTYNLAHIVDDQAMDINLIIRGEEFLSSMPKFLLLYQALGYAPPKFAHVPNILAASGNKKLSKRDGAPDLLHYRQAGILPEAVMSFLATIGWNDGTEQEIYSVQELLEKFSLNRIQKSGARYDEQRLTWLNGHFIRNLKIEDLAKKVEANWPKDCSADEAKKLRILSLVQEKMKSLNELEASVAFFFTPPTINLAQVLALDKQLAKKLDQPTAKNYLAAVIAKLEACDFSLQALESTLRSLVEELATNPSILFKLIRISIAGSPVAPGLFETLNELGQQESLNRLRNIL